MTDHVVTITDAEATLYTVACLKISHCNIVIQLRLFVNEAQSCSSIEHIVVKVPCKTVYFIVSQILIP